MSIRDFPVYALRVLGTARAALLAAGIGDPAMHTMVYRSAWSARIMLSNRPWDADRICHRLLEILLQRRGVLILDDQLSQTMAALGRRGAAVLRRWARSPIAE